jgi:hypothetical protein
MTIEESNVIRHRPGEPGGHYESYFLRANHPERPLAFWIRYTIFSPAGRPDEALGELWAIGFDGERRRCAAVKRELPLRECRFAAEALDVRIGDAALTVGDAVGDVAAGGHAIAWRLAVTGGGAPLLLLPPALYGAALPRAKSLVPRPLARFDGTFAMDGESVPVEGWIGSQNHNWGSRHTDHYAWGQVAGFDGHPGSFLEVATAQLRVGPLWTPRMTPLVLRHAGREHRLNATGRTLRARASVSYFTWTFATQDADVAIDGRIEAPRWAVVGLRYRNPPGGEKHCLNTKIAACTLTLVDRRSGRSETLHTADRAAFEILTDDRSHGVPIAV